MGTVVPIGACMGTSSLVQCCADIFSDTPGVLARLWGVVSTASFAPPQAVAPTAAPTAGPTSAPSAPIGVSPPPSSVVAVTAGTQEPVRGHTLGWRGSAIGTNVGCFS